MTVWEVGAPDRPLFPKPRLLDLTVGAPAAAISEYDAIVDNHFAASDPANRKFKAINETLNWFSTNNPVGGRCWMIVNFGTGAGVQYDDTALALAASNLDNVRITGHTSGSTGLGGHTVSWTPSGNNYAFGNFTLENIDIVANNGGSMTAQEFVMRRCTYLAQVAGGDRTIGGTWSVFEQCTVINNRGSGGLYINGTELLDFSGEVQHGGYTYFTGESAVIHASVFGTDVPLSVVPTTIVQVERGSGTFTATENNRTGGSGGTIRMPIQFSPTGSFEADISDAFVVKVTSGVVTLRGGYITKLLVTGGTLHFLGAINYVIITGGTGTLRGTFDAVLDVGAGRWDIDMIRNGGQSTLATENGYNAAFVLSGGVSNSNFHIGGIRNNAGEQAYTIAGGCNKNFLDFAGASNYGVASSDSGTANYVRTT